MNESIKVLENLLFAIEEQVRAISNKVVSDDCHNELRMAAHCLIEVQDALKMARALNK